MLDDKQLKNEILNSVNDDMIPNLQTSIKAKYLAKEKKKPFFKNAWVWALSTPILACGIAVAVILPTLSHSDPSDVIPPNDNNTPIVIQGKKNEIAFGVLSAANLIPNNGGDLNLKPKFKSNLSNEEFITNMTYLNPYMQTAEAMLSSAMDLQPEVIELFEGEYQYQMNVISNGEEFVFLYNETLLVDEIKPAFEDDDDDEEDEEDEVEDESDEQESEELEEEYKIDGIFEKGQKTYYVFGSKELEQGEYELSLQIYEDLNDKANCILIEQEFENEEGEKEESYLYSIIKENEEIFTAEVGFELEDGEDPAVDVEIVKDGQVNQYQILKDNNNFLAHYQSEQGNGDIGISVIQKDANSYYLYNEIELGYKIELKRN